MCARTSRPFHRLCVVLDIDPVGRGVLADDQKLACARRDQLFRLAQHSVDPAAGELSAQVRDNAEGAGVIAALGNLEIAVMARRQLDVGVGRLRDQIDKRPLRRRCVLMHRLDHLFVLMRAGDREHLRMRGADRVGLVAHAPRDDDAAILGDCLADRGETFFLGAVEEAASVDQNHVGAGVIGAHRIAVCAQAREDALAVDQRLGTTERDHADALGVWQVPGGKGGGGVHKRCAPTPTGRIPLERSLHKGEDLE
jgi:hypothetical protein